MSLMNNLLILFLLSIGAGIVWIVSDYRAWKSLGRGGVPYNFYGWLMVTRFRLAKRDSISTTIYNDRLGNAEDSVNLRDLPLRQGSRPRIGAHPVPHRQLDQFAEENIRQQLDQMFNSFVAANSKHIYFTKSFYEKRNDAVTLIEVESGHALAKISHGEIAHIHPADGSMHMIFSPSDAKQVIEKGWGERHPLAGVPKFDLPDTYLMIYTPRNSQELAVVAQLLRAAVEHLCVCDCASIR